MERLPRLVFNKPKTMNNRYNITYFCLINTRNVDFEWYPWTLENWRHCLGLKRLYILYNIIIISFGMRFSTFEFHSVVVHVFVLVLFVKRYTRRAKMTSTLSLCSLLYITEALSKENLRSVSSLNALWVPWSVPICENNTHSLKTGNLPPLHHRNRPFCIISGTFKKYIRPV